MKRGVDGLNSISFTRRLILKRLLYLSGTLAFTGLPLPVFGSCKLVFPMPKRPQPQRPKHKIQGKIALIIDDIGNSLSLARQFLDLDFSITFSVLPWRPYSSQLVEEISSKGHEVMLHQPMEPLRPDIDPGPGAIYTSSSPAEISETIRKNLREIPCAIGSNNHMGSKFTSTPSKVVEALKVMKEEGLFFIDSFTTASSVAYKTARHLHMHTAYRNIFLDYVQSEGVILSQLDKLIHVAMLHGKAIGIGHPFPVTVCAIKKYVRMNQRKLAEIEFVPVSEVVV